MSLKQQRNTRQRQLVLDVVRGRRVRIGEGCSIGRVEYSESLDAWDGTVGESVCTGEGAQ